MYNSFVRILLYTSSRKWSQICKSAKQYIICPNKCAEFIKPLSPLYLFLKRFLVRDEGPVNRIHYTITRNSGRFISLLEYE